MVVTAKKVVAVCTKFLVHTATTSLMILILLFIIFYDSISYLLIYDMAHYLVF